MVANNFIYQGEQQDAGTCPAEELQAPEIISETIPEMGMDKDLVE